MFNKHYNVINKSNWEGRIDSEDDFHNFRWHQWMEFIDLEDDNLKPFEGKLGFAILGFCSDYGDEFYFQYKKISPAMIRRDNLFTCRSFN